MRLLPVALILLFAGGMAVAKAPQKSYDVQALDVTSQAVIVVKGKEDTKKLGPAIKAAIAKVQAYLTSKNIAATGAPLTKTLLYKQGFLEFETGFPVAKGQKSDGEFLVIELPAGKVAKTVHTGPLDQSTKAYEALHGWMNANKKKPAGNPWEVYVENHKLEVYYPIKDKK